MLYGLVSDMSDIIDELLVVRFYETLSIVKLVKVDDSQVLTVTAVPDVN